MVTNSKINKVLIANRGEIARRIQRACDSLNIPSVVVASQSDLTSLAAREAHEIAPLSGSTARESYLDIGQVLDAAVKTGCNAIHPGYGFLSENADFAEQVESAGLIFIGPSSHSIRALGSKPEARKTVQAAGVPTTPGSEGAQSDADLVKAANRIGYPVIIKAAAGGGGRGMRIVQADNEMAEAITRARSEALKNFGSDEVYLEKFISEPRHVEVQLFGDMHGTVVHFGTRDCSAQRRHQKLVEEAPAPFLSEKMRAEIHDAAVKAAKSVGYYNAGTAEFLVKGDEFYFLEINTRIQVEHPVTEEVTGVDLVQLQLKVAMGEKLPFSQPDITFEGHAIELRINAEDPREGFRPATGRITQWDIPEKAYLRLENGYEAHDTIPGYYDSLIAKVIVKGESRAETLWRAFEVVRSSVVDGVPTTFPFHTWILSCREFQTNGIDIGFVERNFSAVECDGAQVLLSRDKEHKNVEDLPLAPTELLMHGDLQIRLVHEPGGTFLSIPLNIDGTPLEKSRWRRSNSRKAALLATVAGV